MTSNDPMGVPREHAVAETLMQERRVSCIICAALFAQQSPVVTDFHCANARNCGECCQSAETAITQSATSTPRVLMLVKGKGKHGACRKTDEPSHQVYLQGVGS